MAKLLLACALIGAIGSSHAALASVEPLTLHPEEERFAQAIHQVRSLYIASARFVNIENVPLERAFIDFPKPSPEEARKFTLRSEKDGAVAVISYRVQGCARFQHIKRKLVSVGALAGSESATCQNNRLIAKLHKTP